MCLNFYISHEAELGRLSNSFSGHRQCGDRKVTQMLSPLQSQGLDPGDSCLLVRDLNLNLTELRLHISKTKTNLCEEQHLQAYCRRGIL